jgi:hypothetical protein
MKINGQEIRIQGRLVRTAQLEADKYMFLDDPVPLLDGLRRCGARVDLFTFMQRLPECSPKYDYPMEWDNLAVLPITTFDSWWTNQIRFKARNKARQAEKKGVVVREVEFDESLVQGIWELYNECPVRQGRPFSHYGKSTETVRREEATFLDSSFFIGAFLGPRLIGFAKLVADETRMQAGLMNIVSMIHHRDKAPTNALIVQAVRSCAERGIRHLVYSNFSYGKKRWDGISEFKESNGFKRVELPRYYVPLTRLGRAAFQLGLHHKLVDHLPESAAARLRVLRGAWHNRKLNSAAEAS